MRVITPILGAETGTVALEDYLNGPFLSDYDARYRSLWTASYTPLFQSLFDNSIQMYILLGAFYLTFYLWANVSVEIENAV